MEGTKTQMQSSTIQGAIVALVGALITALPSVATLFGYEVSQSDADELLQLFGSLMAAIGGARAWVGRIKATQVIGK